MSDGAALLAILGAVLLGAMSPGPSFLLISRISAARSRSEGLAAALGMGLGAALFGTLALVGLGSLLSAVDWLAALLQGVGGLYLLYLGLRIWRGAAAPLPEAGGAGDSPAGGSLARAFGAALLTQLGNPKTALVYGSLFAALLPTAPAPWLPLVLPLLILAVETAWYGLVALGFSAPRPRAVYRRARIWIDRAAGAGLGLIGARLVHEALSARRG
ncbi:LysE family translocator [Methylobacterium gregans]|uniref:Threonine efflux protein n=1 Tax=Methylobacterium gregans TaxID=374424 RepID=A0AA37HMA8_9HYPH|nr:LysE family transporter [Methylobacterium gregans]MDQ0523875.1 threonine/homoserine/homoserine lactone efflux protein [Methylobacterium gregans]GJD78159.1 Threonine efflux protein [Methylobacterium gregans]GLS54695.1 threonine transporter [Methylobacterium gregans]